LALIVDRVTSPTSKGPILAVLEKLGVRTIGDFCALSETDIKAWISNCLSMKRSNSF
jgi:hypothetical protein